MNTIKSLTVRIIGICMISFLPMTAVWSADEDMISQVYLEFDPETGEFVTAQDPNLTGNSKHSAAQSKQVEQIQSQQDKLAGQQSSADTQAANTAAAPAQQQSSSMAGDGGGSSSTMLIAIVVGVLVVGGIFAFTRKGSQSA